MVKNNKTAKFVGLMLLLAMASSIIGGMLIQGIIDKPDFMSSLLEYRWKVIAGVALELLNAFAVIGIAAALWPLLKQRSPATTAGYFGIRMIEAAACAVAAFVPVILMMLAGRNSGGVISADILCVVRDGITTYVVTLFFGIGAVLLNLMLYRSSLLPKYITIWGLLGAIAVLGAMFIPAIAIQSILAIPIITNEIYLGIYLMLKGFQNNTKDRDVGAEGNGND